MFSSILKPLPKVLWIEDGAKYELREMLGAVYYSRLCTLKLAEDASTAQDALLHSAYDAVIVDIRLPPGNHKLWQALYQKSGRDTINAQLGLRLLEWLCCSESPMRNQIGAPQLIPSKRIGVFTVESQRDIGDRLTEMQIGVFEQKTTFTPDTIIPKIIRRLLDLRQEEKDAD